MCDHKTWNVFLLHYYKIPSFSMMILPKFGWMVPIIRVMRKLHVGIPGCLMVFCGQYMHSWNSLRMLNFSLICRSIYPKLKLFWTLILSHKFWMGHSGSFYEGFFVFLRCWITLELYRKCKTKVCFNLSMQFPKNHIVSLA